MACLEQGIALVKELSTEDFTAKHPALKSGSIGAHFRHNLDHYLRLRENLNTGSINYDARQRDAKIEEDPACAVQTMQALLEFFENITPDKLDQPLKVLMDCGSHDEANWSGSTLRRELQFLISHTIHHYAIIAMLCRLRGIEPAEHFGVAPSTLHYRATA